MGTSPRFHARVLHRRAGVVAHPRRAEIASARVRRFAPPLPAAAASLGGASPAGPLPGGLAVLRASVRSVRRGAPHGQRPGGA